MNMKENLTCKYCNRIYNEPITLTCCGESMCKQHMNELLSIDDTNTFLCPFCDKQNLNQNFTVSKTIQYLLDMEAHNFTIDPKYERVFNDFKTEIRNLEAILNEPENFIYEEINELKRQIDLDREKAKIEIDELADDFIQQLETHKKQFEAEYKANVDMKHYTSLVEASKQQFNEYEKYLNLLSSKAEEREKQSKQSEITINNLQYNIRELKRNLFSNKLFTYKPMEKNIHDLYGKLIIKDAMNMEILGIIQKELRRLKDPDWPIWRPFDRRILSLAVLPNGDLVSGGEDHTIIIWDTNYGTVKQTLTGHEHWIRVLIAIDNNCLISASEDETIKIWNINEGTARMTLIGHSCGVLALLMLENGDLVSGSHDKTIKIWNLEDGTLIKTLTGHTEGVWAFEALKNGDLVSGSFDKSIKIWDINSGEVKRTLKGHSDAVFKIVLLENGDIVSGSRDNKIKIWNTEDGTVKRILIGHTSFVLALKVLPNGDLVSGSADGTIIIWDIESGEDKNRINVYSEINSFEMSVNGNLISASDESIIIWI